jgi:hypothetical protein
MTEMGHEDQFASPSLSGRCQFGQGTFARDRRQGGRCADSRRSAGLWSNAMFYPLQTHRRVVRLMADRIKIALGLSAPGLAEAGRATTEDNHGRGRRWLAEFLLPLTSWKCE